VKVWVIVENEIHKLETKGKQDFNDTWSFKSVSHSEALMAMIYISVGSVFLPFLKILLT
jgi:hypothetical protein